MPLAPQCWNVVVIGRWNRAILTPQGIASRLFELPDSAEVGVEVPMDAIGPYRVSHEGLTVMVSNAMLVVEPSTSIFPDLQRAMQIARRAMMNLPETPVTAVGFNLRFQGPATDESLAPLVDATKLWVDERFTSAGYRISRREISWVTDWQTGRISIHLGHEATSDTSALLRVGVNFECMAGRKEMEEWLVRPAEEVKEQVEKILTSVFQLGMEAVEWNP